MTTTSVVRVVFVFVLCLLWPLVDAMNLSQINRSTTGSTDSCTTGIDATPGNSGTSNRPTTDGGEDDHASSSCKSTTSSPPMRLLLTSSGLVNSHMKRAFQELYQEAVSEPHAKNRNKCIYIMDAALDPDDDDSNHDTSTKYRMVNYMTHELQALGVAEVQGVELRTLSEGGAIDLLHDAACVYLEQGNTYYLLFWFYL